MLKKIYNLIHKLRLNLNQKGQGMVEYALILAAVAIIAVVAIWGAGASNDDKSLKSAVTGAFTKAASAVEDAQKKQ